MSCKRLSMIAAGVSLLACVGAAQADTYKPGEFLLLDLQKAVLSPKLLGPPASFEQVQIQAKADAKANVKADPAKAAPRLVRAQSAKPVAQRAAAQKKVARRSNPLNANAADTRVQVWPCRTGGICSWQK
ncbi:hypothetical protein AB7714_24535 [Tardiphaga sp. 1201_B9_N1_1]|jgi:hypothetical protein|uniref:hypothetical protein n=1 Tax=Tardiphaga TaxID=1395974 RepID=UPI000FF832BF|nr:hypothetical protein [Tardiphaga robiniae]MDR6662276.1 hypothetical protein [Tardiphaga robiniae]